MGNIGFVVNAVNAIKEVGVVNSREDNVVDASVAVNNSNVLFLDDEICHPCIHCVIEGDKNSGKDGV